MGAPVPFSLDGARRSSISIACLPLSRMGRRRGSTAGGSADEASCAFTSVHQSLTFSRRMMLLGGAQAAVGALLVGRLGWLSVAENEQYQLLSESNRVQLILVPPRRGWIVDRNGKPIAINRSSFRVDIIPQQLDRRPRKSSPSSPQLMQLPPDEVERILRELKQSRGFQPVRSPTTCLTSNMPRSRSAFPICRALPATRGFSRYYPAGPAVAHLVGYVGAANAEEYEKETRTPSSSSPVFKIGKEGLEKTLEPLLRGEPGGQRVEVTARGKLVKELDPKPDRSGQTVQLTIDSGLQQYAARRMGDQSGALVAHRRRIPATSLRCRPCRPSTRTTSRDGIGSNRMEDAVGGRPPASRRQGAGGSLPLGIDDQAADGPRLAEGRRRSVAQGRLQQGLSARQSLSSTATRATAR